ncbi:hypothetical protein [Oceanobacillus profundus]|uniref:hypothetical protein n=1 Tax=Oceanobacillus profundus TaxID=372463 RepID=UPI0026E2919F|nr:hypothetical protein [Oceanobacillus profundus]MDO6450496.1 hypothetical protein [Oceanobacillus profundus]
MDSRLNTEFEFLTQHSTHAITISTTAKSAVPFNILPRRVLLNTAISSFMINDKGKLKETLLFFDGQIDYIFIDIEQKQQINLFKIANNIVKKSKLIAIKPNDTTLESCDILIRNHFNDDLSDKNIIVIGTGNLASKTALRLAERQANVFIKGRSTEKENVLVNGLNNFLPKYSPKIKVFNQGYEIVKADIIVSFVSGYFKEEEILIPFINENTFIIDGGINNFSSSFVKRMLNQETAITRLDTRIALPYQLLSIHNYTISFFNDIYGKTELSQVPIVAGGFIGAEGMVIVDNIKNPNQIIGIADGSGGVKKDEQLTKANRESIRRIKETISIGI